MLFYYWRLFSGPMKRIVDHRAQPIKWIDYIGDNNWLNEYSNHNDDQ
jgi:hypothetical protein